MNPAYAQARFRAELPRGALPVAFGVVTAWNPDGRDASAAENETANARLRTALEKAGHFHFPVTGGSADFAHAEPGFGIVADRGACLALGREFRQEAIFWIARGTVHLISCADASIHTLGEWRTLAEAPASHPDFHFQGNLALLDRAPQPFLMSSRCTAQQVLDAYAWARTQCDTGGTVMSGFHSPVECDVFQILTRRGANLIWVPGRDIPKVIPAAMPKLLAQNRLLVASPFDYGKPDRPTRATCLRRNEWIARAVSVGELSLTSASPEPG